jgi:hypothetical protein
MSPHAVVTIASRDIAREKLEEVQKLFLHAGISCRVDDDEAHVIWDKLIRLNAITCAIAASGKSLGFARSDPEWRAVIEGCVREALEVARVDGVTGNFTAVMAHIDSLPASLRTSLARDIDAGNRGELDAIAGAIARKAARNRIATPIISRMIENKFQVTNKYRSLVRSQGFGVSYEDDRAYLLWIPSSEVDESCTQCYRYNILERTWTRWTKTATAGVVVDTGSSLLYIADGDRPIVMEERKNLDRTDFADKDFIAGSF